MAYTRAEKKQLAIERAKRRLQHRLDDIDWEIDWLYPRMQELRARESIENVIVELETDDETEDQ